MNKVTVVMYHYVRDLDYSRYQEIKGLNLPLFIEQIEYLQRHYNIVTMEAVIDAFAGITELPQKAALLTFDDAYIEHYTHVFPILNERKIQGCFYPPVKAITEHTVLDVNKIHFILASVSDKNILIKDILSQLEMYKEEYRLENNEFYLKKLAVANRFDTKEVIFIKRLLQVELEIKLRKSITDYLFKKYVSNSEESFSRELYMNIDQIKCMKRNGMHIGNHGFDHFWLGSLSKEKQIEEIDRSLIFINEIGGDIKNWTMCYPYGSYNQDTLDILKSRGCKLSFTTEVDIVDITKHNRYALPRLDTNDIPKNHNATPDEWYLKG